MTTTLNQLETLESAAEILRAEPFRFDAVVDFPGVLIVSFDNGDDTMRQYITGFSNATFTVDYYPRVPAFEAPEESLDTWLHVSEADHYRLAIQLAALIDRNEHAR